MRIVFCKDVEVVSCQDNLWSEDKFPPCLCELLLTANSCTKPVQRSASGQTQPSQAAPESLSG